MRTRTATFSARGPLKGSARVPGDKSLSHRALLLAGLAEGTSRVTDLSDGEDVGHMRDAVVALGAQIDGELITGGRGRLSEAERPIDVGNSGTAMRLLAGVAASLPFLTVLVGDHSIHRRPMDRVVEPLRAMGATIDARENGRLAPLCIRGGDLVGIDYSPPVPSAQVKGAVLFAGLGASGETVVRESVVTRQHTEELFERAGRPCQSSAEDNRHVVRLRPGVLSPFEYAVPGDPSQAAFLAVAASIVEGSEVRINNVYVGPGRAGFLDVLIRMGADIEVHPHDDVVADLVVRSAALTATEIEGAEIVSLIDEIPVLAVAAAHAQGTTVFRDASELRVKESDRVATTAAGLRALHISVEELPDGLAVTGGMPKGPAVVESAGDHRIAMAFAIAGLSSAGEVTIDDFSSVDTSWPTFAATVESLCS